MAESARSEKLACVPPARSGSAAALRGPRGHVYGYLIRSPEGRSCARGVTNTRGKTEGGRLEHILETIRLCRCGDD